MENTVFLVSVLGPIFLVTSLSVLLYSKTWQKVIEGWMKNHFTLLPLVYMELIFGTFIVYVHNAWTWELPTLFVTILGWQMIIESIFYFILPGEWIKWALKVSKNETVLGVSGILGLAIGLYFCYLAYFPAIQGLFQ